MRMRIQSSEPATAQQVDVKKLKACRASQIKLFWIYYFQLPLAKKPSS